MRIGVLQHRLRTHERMDLAAMLAQSEHAAEEGVQILVFPRIPGLGGDVRLLDAFFRNVTERVPGVTTVRPRWRFRGERPLKPFASGLGRTLVFEGDDCIDPDLYQEIQDAECDCLVWLFDPEDSLQAEAALELALDASLHLAPLIVIATCTGAARGISAHGIGAIVYLGEIVIEGDADEELLIADVPSPASVLQQRLDLHRAAVGRTRGRA